MSQAQQPEALRLADALAYCDSSVAAQAARIAELEQPQAALAAVPLPLLVRDIARDIGITVPQACIALKPLGNYSTNSAVTAEMARMLRDHFPAPAHPAEGVPAPAPIAWRLTNTAFREPRYEYHDTKAEAEARQADFNRSVDDGGLHNLTPLYAALAATPAAPAANAEALQARINELDKDLGQVIGERDTAEGWADGLADLIGKYFGRDVGEHSSAHCPWQEAKEIIEEAEPCQPAPTPAAGVPALSAADGIEQVAKMLQKRADAYADDHLSTDPDTGATEGSDAHIEYWNWLLELVDLVRALKPDAAGVPAAAPDARDAYFEAVRNRLCGLQRYSFVLDDDGEVRRVQDRTGNWIEFDDAHELFDPVSVDAAIAAQAGKGAA